MLGKYWVPSREGLINKVFNSFMDEAMLSGYDIVLDNMNLNKKTLAEIKEYVEDFNKWISLSPLAKSHKYEIEYKKFLDVPLETCIERDSKRPQPTGRETIENIYKRYKDEYEIC